MARVAFQPLHLLCGQSRGRSWRSSLRTLILVAFLAVTVWSKRAAASGDDEEEEGGSSQDETQASTGSKIGALFCFFGASFLGVSLPYFIPVRPNFLKLGILFSAGLFIAVALLHMIRECAEIFEEMYSGEYPLGYLIPAFGFFMTWFADVVAGAVWSHRQASSDQEAGVSDEKPGEDDPSIAGAVMVAGGSEAWNGLSFLDVIILLVALCSHAFFEGLAVGLTPGLWDMWNLTLSICINEFFEGMALGATLRAQDTKRPAYIFFLYAAGVSLVAPVGVAIGTIIISTANHDAAEWAEAIGYGLSAGVFIRVACSHLVVKAMRPSSANEPVWMPFLKWFVAGLGLMTNALTALRPE